MVKENELLLGAHSFNSVWYISLLIVLSFLIDVFTCASRTESGPRVVLVLSGPLAFPWLCWRGISAVTS